MSSWLRGVDLNHRPLGYEPNELPDCSTPQFDHSNRVGQRQISEASFTTRCPHTSGLKRIKADSVDSAKIWIGNSTTSVMGSFRKTFFLQ
jgi:hypothetical protein